MLAVLSMVFAVFIAVIMLFIFSNFSVLIIGNFCYVCWIGLCVIFSIVLVKVL